MNGREGEREISEREKGREKERKMNERKRERECENVSESHGPTLCHILSFFQHHSSLSPRVLCCLMI